MKQKIIVLTLLLSLSLSISTAITENDSNQLTCQECRIQHQELQSRISNLTKNISDLKDRIDYYQNQTEHYRNLSQYYRQQYLSDDASLTNRRVKEIYENITMIRQEINYNQDKILNLKQKFQKIVTKKVFYIGIVFGGLFGGLIGSIITFEIAGVEVLKKVKRKILKVKKSGNNEEESS